MNKEEQEEEKEEGKKKSYPEQRQLFARLRDQIVGRAPLSIGSGETIWRFAHK